MIPLSNISIIQDPHDYNYDYILDIYPGDLLYIPSYWWHKVITLEDDSININFNFYVKEHKLSERQKNIFALHKLTNSSWWHRDSIHNFANLDNVSMRSMFNVFIKECFVLVLLALFLGYYSSKFNTKYFIYCLVILILIKNSQELEYLTYGYFTTLMFFMIPIFISGYIIGLYKN
jgi:hypothetical protein